MNADKRLTKIELTQKAILDKLDTLTLTIERGMNKERENTTAKFRGYNPTFDGFTNGYSRNAIGDR